MRDKDFQLFIDEFGEATHRAEVPQVALDRWRRKLPDRLLGYWKSEGWCGYANGLFWTVNPDEYEDLVDEWLKDSPLEEIDAFHVIARSAFGKLYLFGETRGGGPTINPAVHCITALQSDLGRKDKNELDFEAGTFLSFQEKNYCDLKDRSGAPLFVQALQTLGPLEPDEMYGFEPAIVLGGSMQLENLHKVKLKQHLTVLRQLAAPTMPFAGIDVEALLKTDR